MSDDALGWALMIVVFCMTLSFGWVVGEITARADQRAAIVECQKDLPRNQHCVAVITAEVVK